MTLTDTLALARAPARQKRVGKAIAGFFALMAFLTLLSRGIYSYTLATVSVTSLGHGAITHSFQLEGVVAPLTETAVVLPAGHVVSQVLIQEGGRIREGDPVARLDATALESQLETARRELQSARLAAAVKLVQPDKVDHDPLKEAELRLERAQMDLERQESDSAEAVARAQEDLRAARREYRDSLDSNIDLEDDASEELKKQITLMERAAEDAYRQAERDRESAARQVEDARLAIEAEQRSQAVTQAEDAAQSQVRSLESAQDGLTIVEREQQVARLEQLLASGGELLAERSGVVTKLLLSPGEVTVASGAYLLAEESSGSVFEGTATKKDWKRLHVGDNVTLSFPGQREDIQASITYLTPAEDDKSPLVGVRLPDTYIAPGTAGTLHVEKRDGDEGQLLPLSAIHSEGGEASGRGYVFVLRERSTTMGVQTVVEKMSVDILDRGDTSARISSALTREDQIVLGSSTPLSEGARVKLEAPS